MLLRHLLGVALKPLKLLCFADVHSAEAAPAWSTALIERFEPALVLVAGDITHRGPLEFAQRFVDVLLGALPARRVLAVHGNMDPAPVAALLEQRGVSIHGRRVQRQGYVFVGLGGSPPTPFDTPCEYSEEEIERFAAPLRRGDILLSHAPPHGTFADWTGSTHIGSKAARALIERRRPAACICAHAHEAAGAQGLQDTLIVKLPPLKHGGAAIVELPSLRTRFVHAQKL